MINFQINAKQIMELKDAASERFNEYMSNGLLVEKAIALRYLKVIKCVR